MIWLTALITGLLSSLHCVGMCGPIALATPATGTSRSSIILGKLLYNLGRTISYASLGYGFGLFGSGFKMAGMQQTLSIAAGILMIAGAIWGERFLASVQSTALGGWRMKAMSQWFGKRGYQASFMVGVFNGLLPCGMVYIALLGSLATQSALAGSLFMIVFGLGTIPMMFSISLMGMFIPSSSRSLIRRFTPVLVVMIGCLFVLRGMNLGIPYVSPQLTDTIMVKQCHP